MLQAHSFEDRVLKIDHVRIRRRATVGRGVVLMYGADIGAGARVLPHSVVMKNERLLPGVTYVGNPVRPVPRPAESIGPELAAVAPLPRGGRQSGLDAARGLAVAGMVFLHLVPGEDPEAGAAGAAEWAVELLNGKPASLFCVLAGVAWSLQARGGVASSPARRALVLGVAGIVFGLVAWPTQILLPMALMLLACAPLRRSGLGGLVAPVVFLLAAVPIAQSLFGHWVELDWDAEGNHAADGTIGWATLRSLVYDGSYPLLPWLVFPLIGMAFATIDWTTRGRARRAFLVLAPSAVLVEAASRYAAGHAEELGALAPHLTSTWEPTSVPFVVVGVLWSLAITTGCLWWHARAGRVRGLVALGRASLTHYLLHILVVFSALRFAYPDEDWSVTTGLVACAAYLAVAWPLSTIWFRRFRRGPFEALWTLASGGRKSVTPRA
jgi:uncharacterized membrane protein YeiB